MKKQKKVKKIHRYYQLVEGITISKQSKEEAKRAFKSVITNGSLNKFIEAYEVIKPTEELYAWTELKFNTWGIINCLVTDRRVLLFKEDQGSLSLLKEILIRNIEKAKLGNEGEYSVITLKRGYETMKLEKVPPVIAKLVRNWIENKKTQLDEGNMDPIATAHVKTKEKSIREQIANMNGYEFEKFVAELFEEMGYETEVTSQSNDQGVDVIAETPFETLAIQAKKYSKSVSNSAVQEIVAAKNPTGADKAIVVATSAFTRSAKSLAQANGVRLVNKEELLSMANEYM